MGSDIYKQNKKKQEKPGNKSFQNWQLESQWNFKYRLRKVQWSEARGLGTHEDK